MSGYRIGLQTQELNQLYGTLNESIGDRGSEGKAKVLDRQFVRSLEKRDLLAEKGLPEFLKERRSF